LGPCGLQVSSLIFSVDDQLIVWYREQELLAFQYLCNEMTHEHVRPRGLIQDNYILRPWQTRTHCCGHIVAHDVPWAAQTGKHLLRIQNVSEQNQKHFCVPDTKFVSATNVARAGKRGNNCVGNNVSATMCPRLPGPLF